jgi:hypothetical protein
MEIDTPHDAKLVVNRKNYYRLAPETLEMVFQGVALKPEDDNVA